jgi:predicted lipoprotein with Yx(FWY)xxD motif
MSRKPLPAMVIVLLLAACRGAGAGSPSVAAGEGDATVSVAEAEGVGEHLVDAEGRSLYIFLNDSPGESACTGSCADTWPPAAADGADPTAGDGVSAELATIERDDGTQQLTLAGWPLYTYAADEAPGDVTGEGVGEVWFVARPDGSVPGEGGAGEMSAEPSAEGSAEESEGYDPYDY